jgi:hypothetical protein
MGHLFIDWQERASLANQQNRPLFDRLRPIKIASQHHDSFFLTTEKAGMLERFVADELHHIKLAKCVRARPPVKFTRQRERPESERGSSVS